MDSNEVRTRIRARTSRRVAAIIGASAVALLLALPSGASATQHVVFVADDADPSAVARSVGARVDVAYEHVARGFAADLSAAQVARLQSDARVLELRADRPFALTPFKRYPFKRYPFKRFPFKRYPFKRYDADSPYAQQLLPTGVERIGASDWADDVDADIAILDGGVDRNHPDLNVVAAVSCVAGAGPRDRDGHGTMVAGLAAAKNNRIGIVGAAPGARIWSVKVADDDGTIMESAALCGLDYVLTNARRIEVANLSWGGEAQVAPASCDTLRPQSSTRTRDWRRLGPSTRGRYPWRRPDGRPTSTEPVTHDVLQGVTCELEDAGVTLVAAAGNEAQDATSYLPAAWPTVFTVSSLSDTDGLPGGLGEAGCISEDPDDTLSSFSNFGSVVDIAAPGECLVTTDTNGGYAVGSGTSFAAPLVSGVAAVHASLDRDATPASIRARLLADAEPGPIPGDDDGYSEGVLRAVR